MAVNPTERLTVVLEAQQWEAILNMLADHPVRIALPLIQDIQRQCMQQADPAPYTSPALRGNGEARQAKGESNGEIT